MKKLNVRPPSLFYLFRNFRSQNMSNVITFYVIYILIDTIIVLV